MRVYRRSRLATALCLAVVVGLTAAMVRPVGSATPGAVSSSTAPPHRDVLRELSEFADLSLRPLRRAPPGALRRARARAAELALPSQAGPVTGAAPNLSVPWTQLGPQAIGSSAAWIGSTSNPFIGTYAIAGRVNSIATDPTNAGIAYLGAANGGVWKTMDAGLTWKALFDAQASLAIGAVAVDPNNHLTVYAGTGDYVDYYGLGIFKSIDGGASWSNPSGSTFDGCKVTRIAVEPGDSTTVLASVTLGGKPSPPAGNCAATGIFRSSDGGATWSQVLSGAGSDVAVDRTRPTIWYAGLANGGLWKSVDGGLTWAQVSGGLPATGMDKVVVAVSPSNGQRLYSAMAQPSSAAGAGLLGLWTSADGGTTWAPLATDPDFCANEQCWYDPRTLAVDPLDPSTLYAGGTKLFRYTGGGAAHTAIAFGPVGIGYGQTAIHFDQQALTFDASRRLWVGNDGGAYRTADGGATFANLNATLAITQEFQGISGGAAYMLGGSQDNGTELYSGERSWRLIDVGDGGGTAIDPTNPATVFTEAGGLNIARSLTKGEYLDPNYFTTFSDQSYFDAPLLLSPANHLQVYAGAQHVFRADDSGVAFTSYHAISPLFGCCVTKIGLARSDPSTVYAGTGEAALYVSTNAMTASPTWTNTIGNGFAAFRIPRAIVVNPNNAAEAFTSAASFGTGHVFHTVNDGGAWTDISGNLPDIPVRALVIDTRTSPLTIYAGTDTGVFISSNLGVAWAAYGTGLPNAAVTDLLLDPATNRLVAGTYGRGMWSAPLATATPGLVAVGVTAGGFSPASPAVKLGKPAVWNFAATNASDHTATDTSGLALFDSGLRSAGAAFAQTFNAAAAYPVTDMFTGHTGFIQVAPRTSRATGTTTTSFTITWAVLPPPAGDVYDVRIQRPGGSFTPWMTWVSAQQATFVPDGGTGTYLFSALVRSAGTGAVTGWSPPVSITVS